MLRAFLLNAVAHRVALSILFATLSSVAVFAQPQAVTRVEGKITDEQTGAPVECKVFVYDAEGKRVRSISSNSTDGSYLLVLNEAGTYKFSLGGHNVYRKDYEVVVPKSGSFQEVKKDVTVRVFKQGTMLYSGIGFERGSTTLTATAQQELQRLKGDLDVNQQLQVVIRIASDPGADVKIRTDAVRKYLSDSIAWSKSMAAFDKKYRKAKEKPAPPIAPVRPTFSESGNDLQYSARKASIQAMMTDVRNGEIRIVYEAVRPSGASSASIDEKTILTELTSKKVTKRAAAPPPVTNEPNLFVAIGEVKRLFGN